MVRVPDGEVELVRVQGHINAEPIIAALRANGIPARILGEALGSVYGLTLDGLGEVVIAVAEGDAERARELLADADDRQLDLPDDWRGDDGGLPGGGDDPTA